ncbi:MPS3 [Acrasis kona]|uniref:MPS3 n=1 Tax=Acrasis kona TaxID=1008807 RepID=A0AAW2ZB07_9EUKA
MDEQYLSPGRYSQIDYLSKDVLFFDTTGASLEVQEHDLKTHQDKIEEGEKIHQLNLWTEHIYQRFDSLIFSSHNKHLIDQFAKCKHMIRLDRGLKQLTYYFEKRDSLRNIFKGDIRSTSSQVQTVSETTSKQLEQTTTWDNFVSKSLDSPFDVNLFVYPNLSTNLNLHYTFSPISLRTEIRQEPYIYQNTPADKKQIDMRRFIFGGTLGLQFPRVNAEFYYEVDKKPHANETNTTIAAMALLRLLRSESQRHSCDAGLDITARNGSVGNLTYGIRYNYVSQGGRRTVGVLQGTYLNHYYLSFTHDLRQSKLRKRNIKPIKINLAGREFDVTSFVKPEFDLTTSGQIRYLNTDKSSDMTFGLQYRHKSLDGDDAFVLKSRYDTEKGAAVMLSKRFYLNGGYKLDASLKLQNSLPIDRYDGGKGLVWDTFKDTRFGFGFNLEY